MSAFSDAVLADTPLFYFDCGDLTGTSLTDATGNGHIGALSGSYTLNQSAMTVATGKAVAFSNGMVSVPHAAVFNVAGDYAVEMVMRFSASTYGYAMTKIDDFAPYSGPTVMVNYTMPGRISKAGSIIFRQSQNVEDCLEIGGVTGLMLNDNLYRHYFFVRRGLTLEAWINGILIQSITFPTLRSATQTRAATIMNCDLDAHAVVGACDEAVFYDHAPSSDRIALHARLAANLWRLAGNATLATGAAASEVVARDWATHQHVAATVPASDGSFEMFVPATDYDVTVFGPTGYQPMTHGPVTPVAE